jgi:HAE1 family hydrophobic/amphiphilic exporter-1
MAGISGDIISLNIMSLGGLALGIGNLVDNAIVVLESVFRCREEGDSVVDAAERGTQEVAGAVTSSTFTTVAVFFPVAFVEGIAGQLFRDLALTVTFSQVASLLVALYLIPLVASRKGAHIEANRSVIWILRAFRENRDKHGKSVAASILLIPTTSLRYAVEFLGQSAREDLIPSLQSAAGKDGAGKALLSIALLPLLLPVFVLQLFLNLLKVIAVTFFFALTALLLVAFLLIRFLMNVILWLPLRIFDLCFETLRLSYQVILVNSLRFAPIVLLCAGLLAAHALYASRGIGSELVPPMKQGEFGIRVEGLAGTRLEETEARARRIEDVLRDVPEIKTVTVEIGQEDAGQSSETGENVAEFTVLLHDPERAAAMQDEIIDRVRNQIGTFATEEITFTLPAMFSFKNALEIQLVGDDLDVLRDIGTKALELVRTVPGVEDAELSIKQGYPEVIIELDRELLAAKGITPGQVAQRLRTEVQGEVATKFSTLGEKIDMRVRTNQRMLQSVDDLRRVSVSTGTSPIPLEAVATITVQDGPSEIRRVDQRQVALISANASGRDLASMSKDILAIVEQVPRPRDYYFLTGGQLSELQTSNSSLIFAMILAVFLVYVVMACEFESFLDPLLVMFSIPLAFIGVVYALLYTQTDLSIMVFLGGIILVGIVTNNAIVLVDYINILRRRGYKKRQAVIEAGNVRLRPILMTMITTVLGLVPMVASTGDGAELRRPLAVTLMAGLFCATMLTLVIIPAVYELFGERDKPETAS